MQAYLEEHLPRMEENGLQQVTFARAMADEGRIGLLMRFRNEYDFDYFTNSGIYGDFIAVNPEEHTLHVVSYPVGSQRSASPPLM